MDKVETKQTVKEERTHKFYCDECGKHLMTSYEHDDGYYAAPDQHRIAGFTLEGHYCEQCGKYRIDDLMQYARAHGFKF